MKVLVVYGSKYGSTREIAESIGAELQRHAHEVVVHAGGDAPAPDGHDAVVIGSGVYMGQWLPEASRYLDAHAGALARLPVWLFSSGPLGHDDPQPAGEPQQVAQLVAQVAAREHATFVGRLDRKVLRWPDKLIVRVVKAPNGDFRDWDAIRAWACSIAEALAEAGVAETATTEPPCAGAPTAAPASGGPR